jgi:hypothetical protein
MQTLIDRVDPGRYAKATETSRRVGWDIDKDVLRGRQFDFSGSFLPDGLTKLGELPFLVDGDRRLMNRIQGRTYANMFGLVERFISAKVIEISQDHWLGDQHAFEALVVFSEQELKHQELFRRIEAMIARGMPAGYQFVPQPNDVAKAVLSMSTWAVLALTNHIELFTLAHYRESIEPNADLSPLFKDVLLHHWKEESQHAILDELEWKREDAKLAPGRRDGAVDDFIALVGAVDGILQVQAKSDVRYFLEICEGKYDAEQVERLEAGTLRAYRWQYIVSGAQLPRFVQLLGSLVTEEQGQRIGRALAPLLA